MEWVLLVVNIGLAGLLVWIWLAHLERVQELKGRQEHARLRIEEHRQEIDKAHARIAIAERQMPELEEQSRMLRTEIAATSGHLDSLKSAEEGLPPSRYQA